jgi:hypothetical protein
VAEIEKGLRDRAGDADVSGWHFLGARRCACSPRPSARLDKRSVLAKAAESGPVKLRALRSIFSDVAAVSKFPDLEYRMAEIEAIKTQCADAWKKPAGFHDCLRSSHAQNAISVGGRAPHLVPLSGYPIGTVPFGERERHEWNT